MGWSKKGKQWQAKLIGECADSDGKADMFSPPGGVPNLAVGFDNYEDCTSDSFIRQDLGNYLPGALSIFADDGDHRAWSGSIRLKDRL